MQICPLSLKSDVKETGEWERVIPANSPEVICAVILKLTGSGPVPVILCELLGKNVLDLL